MHILIWTGEVVVNLAHVIRISIRDHIGESQLVAECDDDRDTLLAHGSAADVEKRLNDLLEALTWAEDETLQPGDDGKERAVAVVNAW